MLGINFIVSLESFLIINFIFITASNKVGSRICYIAQPARPPPPYIDIEGDHRHRKTEKEEDEELMNLVKKSETLIRFFIRIFSNNKSRLC